MIGDNVVLTNNGFYKNNRKEMKIGIEAPIEIIIRRGELLGKEKSIPVVYKRSKKLIGDESAEE